MLDNASEVRNGGASDELTAVGSDGKAAFDWVNAFGGFSLVRGVDFRYSHPRHVHSTYVIGVIDRGASVILRRGQGGQEYVARAGSLVLLSPYEVHMEGPAANDSWSFRYLYPGEAVVRAVFGVGTSESWTGFEFACPVVDDELLASRLSVLHDRLVRPDESADRWRELGDVLTSIIRRHGRYRAAEPSRQGWRRSVGAAKAFLERATATDVSLAALSNLTGLSRYHLTRVFRDDVGLPPYRYFEQVRLARAKELLLRGHSLSATAFGLGFSDQSHFTRDFKDTSPLTPGQYARMTRLAVSRSRDRLTSETRPRGRLQPRTLHVSAPRPP